MSLKVWKWVSGLASFLLLICPLVYSRLVFIRAPEEGWSWLHQLVGTFFSVAFASAVAVWLYTWQTEKNSSDRRKELRAAELIGVFDAWDRLGDDHLQEVELPDGTKEKVLLTFLQTTVYDESIRSGLFGAAETFTLSRLSSVIHLYNGRVERLLPVLKSIGKEGDAPNSLVEEWRSEIHGVQDARQLIVTAGENLMKLWTFAEIRAALDVTEPNSRDDADPRVEQIVENALPKITPAGYKAGLYDRLEHAKQAASESDHEAAGRFLDEAITEAQSMSGTVIRDEDAQQFIGTVDKARESLKDLSNE